MNKSKQLEEAKNHLKILKTKYNRLHKSYIKLQCQYGKIINQYSFNDAIEENLRLRKIKDLITRIMTQIVLGDICIAKMKSSLGNKISKRELTLLYEASLDGPIYNRKKVLSVIFYLYGFSPQLIAQYLSLYPRTIKKYINNYNQVHASDLLNRTRKDFVKKQNDPKYQEQLLAILNAPPSDYGINRKTWTHKLVKKVMDEKGFFIGKNTVLKVIKNTGFRFRKDREVLTSNDPNYKEKLKNTTKILSNLGPDDRFFSIDEFGPFSIKKRAGRLLVQKNEYPIIPQYQFSKGFLIITAALELSTNQVTHFFSKKKDSAEMIRLLNILIRKYSGCRKIYFSWDAASWHSSKIFLQNVGEVNKFSYRKKHNTPIVELAPLPARAQFLNVIESVFSGMATALIHNSDYQSVSEAKVAINRYFQDRNAHFKKYPKRAGNKIWGNEEVPARFKEGQICKNRKWVRFSSLP